MFGLSNLFKKSRSASRSYSFRPGLEQFGGASLSTGSGRICRSFRPEMEMLEERSLMSASGSVSSITDALGRHTDYWIAPDQTVMMRQNGQTMHLGGRATKLSAGLDANGNPEVWFIGRFDGFGDQDTTHLCLFAANNTPHVFNTTTALMQLSATEHHEVYVLGADGALSVNGGQDGAANNDFHSLGGQIPTAGSTISAGTDGFTTGLANRARDFVYAIGGQTVYVNFSNLANGDATTHPWDFKQVSGQFERVVGISGAENHQVYGLLDTGNVAQYTLPLTRTSFRAFTYTPGTATARNLGGRVLAISAGVDSNGNDQVFATGTDNRLYVNPTGNNGDWRDRGLGSVASFAADRGNYVVAVQDYWNWTVHTVIAWAQDPETAGMGNLSIWDVLDQVHHDGF